MQPVDPEKVTPADKENKDGQIAEGQKNLHLLDRKQVRKKEKICCIY